jgi:hypothetical protein
VKTNHDIRRFLQTASQGLDCGAHMRSAMTMEWDLAGRCEAPVHREMTARSTPEGIKGEILKVATDRRDIEFTARCGKCRPCLKRRAAHWRYRAKAETAYAPRTWFVTLTLRPEEHFRVLCQASQRTRERTTDEFESMDEERQFQARHREISRELTLWLKRIRKQSGAKLRYCLVAERHKSGLPHYHALLHEVRSDEAVRAAVIREQWQLGFSTAKLVAQQDGDRSASYVAKYLSKSASARVRASVGYGQICAYVNPPLGIAKRENHDPQGGVEVIQTNAASLCDATVLPEPALYAGSPSNRPEMVDFLGLSS